MVAGCGDTILCGAWNKPQSLEEIFIEDKSAEKLSHVGRAAYNALNKKHAWYHHRLWNVTSGKIIGDIQQTPLPKHSFSLKNDPNSNHSDWFPQKMYDVMVKTEVWCDVMSLGPPDGIFMDKMKEALDVINKNAEQTVYIRMMFGNIVGMPVNCDAVIKALCKDLPADTKIQLWVGAWRKGASWNHAKMIAVDGRYLHTGGHNMWDPHYLKNNPVHDLSMELEGRITHDGHLFANEQWAFIKKKQSGFVGQMAEKLPDSMPLIWKNRVIISEFPDKVANEFPPQYTSAVVPRYEKPKGSVPIVSIGRIGTLLPIARPADDAIIAMIDSAKTIIKMSLQDLGPVCIPGTKRALPGLCWPKPYLKALARVIYTKGVDVEIVLSNPGSIPGGLTPLDAQYGNGWTCVDCAAEIIKQIKKQFRSADAGELRTKVEENLRVCFIKHEKKSTYDDEKNIGNHSKFFMVDDQCSYTGSQNLYVCDLAEWGVVVDDKASNEKILETFWNPMWEASYTPDDCDVHEVMDGLDIDRDGDQVGVFSIDGQSKLGDAAAMGMQYGSGNSDFYGSEGSTVASTVAVTE